MSLWTGMSPKCLCGLCTPMALGLCLLCWVFRNSISALVSSVVSFVPDRISCVYRSLARAASFFGIHCQYLCDPDQKSICFEQLSLSAHLNLLQSRHSVSSILCPILSTARKNLQGLSHGFHWTHSTVLAKGSLGLNYSQDSFSSQHISSFLMSLAIQLT